jgi:hypothetical protein
LSIDFRGSVSLPPGYPSYRALTFALVGLTPTEYTSLCWTYIDRHFLILIRLTNPLREIRTVWFCEGGSPRWAMMDPDGHEAGNGGYSQGKSKVHRVSSTRRRVRKSLEEEELMTS